MTVTFKFGTGSVRCGYCKNSGMTDNNEIRVLLQLNRLLTTLVLLMAVTTQIFLLGYDIEYRFVALAVDIVTGIVLFWISAFVLTENLKVVVLYLSTLACGIGCMLFHVIYPIVIFTVFEIK